MFKKFSRFSIRRESLLEDAYRQVMSASKKELAKSRLFIAFDREEGLDYGGPSRLELIFKNEKITKHKHNIIQI